MRRGAIHYDGEVVLEIVQHAHLVQMTEALLTEGKSLVEHVAAALEIARVANARLEEFRKAAAGLPWGRA